MMFAGFWQRFLARLLDGIIVLLIALVIGFVLGLIIGFASPGLMENPAVKSIFQIIGGLVGIFYQASFISSKKMATPGRLALDIYVTDMHGMPLSFGKAFWRELLISILAFGPLILMVIPLTMGKQSNVEAFTQLSVYFIFWSLYVIAIYIMQIFTAKRQTLYDLLAGVLVLKKGMQLNQESYSNNVPETKYSPSNSSYALVGFDDNGYVARLSFDSQNNKLASEGMFIGRDNNKCDLVLNDTTVSRCHAKLTQKSDVIYLEDLGSTNQTSVNNRVLTPGIPVRLSPGDLIRVGKVELSLSTNN